MKALAIIANDKDYWQAIDIYRVTMPFYHADTRSRHSFGFIRTKKLPDLIRSIKGIDVITIARHVVGNVQKSMDMVMQLRRLVGKVVYETDDDLTERYRDVSGGKGLTMLPFLNIVDAITVSTKPLGELVHEYAPSVPVHVLPNHVETRMFANAIGDSCRKYHGTLNVMLAGTPTHENDWRIAVSDMMNILDSYSNVRLLVAGSRPDYVAEHERIEYIKPVNYFDYPKVLHEADILVCAIDPGDPFNNSKSAVKALEGWSARRRLGNGQYGGAAVVATKSLAYSGTVRNGRTGLMVDNVPGQYASAVSRLIEDNILRQKVQHEGWKQAVNKHDIRQGYRKWVSAYNKIMRRKQ